MVAVAVAASSSRTWRTEVPNWDFTIVQHKLEPRILDENSGRPFHMVDLPLSWSVIPIGRRHGFSVFRALFTSIIDQLVATQLCSCRNLWEIAQWHVIDIDFVVSVLKMNLVQLSRIQMCLRNWNCQVTFDLTLDKNKVYQRLFDAFASCDVSNGVWSHFVIGYNFTFLASKSLEFKYVVLCWWTK
jgi:hypothetical protein